MISLGDSILVPITAILTQRVDEKDGKKKWALVSRKKGKDGKRRVLEWYGEKKPSEERVKKTEKRITYFKNK